MYQIFEARVRRTIQKHILKHYNIEVNVVVERPPRLEMGEISTPVCFELAKKLKKAPRLLAQEIANKIEPPAGIARFEVAGGGYLNAYIDRAAYFAMAAANAGKEEMPQPEISPKIVIEHTSINPNKAAHIGHLRNAVLGDTFARLLRHAGHRVEVQNYIDNTGVQVADVVLGFIHLERKSADDVRRLTHEPRFDYLCWDLYARVSQFLEEDKARLAMRAETLKAIEEGHGIAAEIGAIVSTAIVRCHLRTLDRLGIDYDLLSQESEILHLKFWDAAFALLKDRGAIRLSTSGKTAGCWIMPLPSASEPDASAEEENSEEEADAKIIVRSNGTVTYVGKDIAYHLWKFGLLGRDFHYQRFHTHPDGHIAWVTASERGEKGAPAFGHAKRVYNVIDSRQAYPQQVVALALRGMGFNDEADNLSHLSYDVVALTPRCAAELGYEVPADAKGTVEVSGRKGQGVKADDLLDRLEIDARAEVDARHPDSPEAERAAIAHAIAIGALRYFLLKYTRTTIIAFDFKDALSFEGETGPYVQYAIVRIKNIFRKLMDQEPDFRREKLASSLSAEDLAPQLEAPAGNDLWEILLLAGTLGAQVHTALGALEPAFVAKFAFQLAQQFNIFYHKHHILSEENPKRKALLLALADLVQKQLIAALGVLGIEAPEKM